MDLNKYCGEIFVFNNKNGEMVVKALENQGFELVLNRADKEMFSYVIKIKNNKSINKINHLSNKSSRGTFEKYN